MRKPNHKTTKDERQNAKEHTATGQPNKWADQRPKVSEFYRTKHSKDLKEGASKSTESEFGKKPKPK